MAGRCREPTFHWPSLTANVEREVTRLEAAYTNTLERST